MQRLRDWLTFISKALQDIDSHSLSNYQNLLNQRGDTHAYTCTQHSHERLNEGSCLRR